MFGLFKNKKSEEPDELDSEKEEEIQDKLSWSDRLKGGLQKTSSSLSDGITGIFTKRKLDQDMLDELEDLLIMSDMGASVAAQIVQKFGESRFDKEISPEEVKEALADMVADIVEPVASELEHDYSQKPQVMVMVGVNGNGKTTTMGKMASQFTKDGRKVMLVAADTFRAAAVEQLAVWGERSGVEVVTPEKEGADAAAVAYRAYERAKSEHFDIVMIDTAGRLHNKNNLMQELEKIIRVLSKIDNKAPHNVIQVLDGTTGQNAVSQVEAFTQMVNVNGLVVTKLDGTAKGGIIVALAEKFALPIHAIGVGEGIADLQPFSPQEFAKSLFDIKQVNSN